MAKYNKVFGLFGTNKLHTTVKEEGRCGVGVWASGCKPLVQIFQPPAPNRIWTLEARLDLIRREFRSLKETSVPTGDVRLRAHTGSEAVLDVCTQKVDQSFVICVIRYTNNYSPVLFVSLVLKLNKL